MQINRSELLSTLEALQPGLTLKEVVEQSSCFAFQDGMVMTYNDEIACRMASPLKINGAVPAMPLLNVLRGLPEEEVDINLEGNLLVIRGKGRKSGIRTQAEVTLAIEKAEIGDEWKKVHEDFSDAISVAKLCVDKDQSNYAGSCIHIHRKYVEACDNSQAIRYRLKTGVQEPILVRGSSIKHIDSLGMTEFCETEAWIHFRNPSGLIFSCRRDPQPYESLDTVLEMEGEPLTLPKGLGEAAKRCETFSAENADENEVLVIIEPGRMRIQGDGASGWFKEVKKIKYAGEPLSFRVGPSLLVELVKRYNDCHIAPDRLKVDTGKFVYVVALGLPENAKEEIKAAKEAGLGEEG